MLQFKFLHEIAGVAVAIFIEFDSTAVCAAKFVLPRGSRYFLPNPSSQCGYSGCEETGDSRAFSVVIAGDPARRLRVLSSIRD